MTPRTLAPRLAEAVRRRRRRLLAVRLARRAGRRSRAKHPQRKRSCILLWMNGGPSQMDTFDLKPGHANGGPFKEIATSVPGIKISEHLPKIAKHMDKHGHHPLDEHQGSRPRPGHLPDAHRPSARRPGPVSDARLAVLQGTGTARRRAAQLRQHRAVPLLQPGGLRPRLPRPAVRPAGRRREAAEPHPHPRPADANYEDSLKVQDLDLPAGVDAERAGGPRRAARRDAERLPRQARPPSPSAEPSQRLPAGRDPDALQRHQGVRPGRGAEGAARPLRPQPVRPGLSAGPPAGRARRAVRRGVAGHGRQPGPRLGHAPQQLRRRQAPQRGARPGLVHADGRPARTRPARLAR